MEFLRALRRWLGAIRPGTGALLPWGGGVLLALAAVFAAHSWWMARGLVRATATVTDNVESFAPGGGIEYTPRLRFRTADGQLVRVLSRRSDEDVEFADGKRVPVMYPQGNPRGAVIATLWLAYHTAWVLAIWGAVVFDVGLVTRRWGKSREYAAGN